MKQTPRVEEVNAKSACQDCSCHYIFHVSSIVSISTFRHHR